MSSFHYLSSAQVQPACVSQRVQTLSSTQDEGRLTAGSESRDEVIKDSQVRVHHHGSSLHLWNNLITFSLLSNPEFKMDYDLQY